MLVGYEYYSFRIRAADRIGGELLSGYSYTFAPGFPSGSGCKCVEFIIAGEFNLVKAAILDEYYPAPGHLCNCKVFVGVHNHAPGKIPCKASVRRRSIVAERSPEAMYGHFKGSVRSDEEFGITGSSIYLLRNFHHILRRCPRLSIIL